jgi:hypothetical protein
MNFVNFNENICEIGLKIYDLYFLLFFLDVYKKMIYALSQFQEDLDRWQKVKFRTSLLLGSM